MFFACAGSVDDDLWMVGAQLGVCGFTHLHARIWFVFTSVLTLFIFGMVSGCVRVVVVRVSDVLLCKSKVSPNSLPSKSHLLAEGHGSMLGEIVDV